MATEDINAAAKAHTAALGATRCFFCWEEIPVDQPHAPLTCASKYAYVYHAEARKLRPYLPARYTPGSGPTSGPVPSEPAPPAPVLDSAYPAWCEIGEIVRHRLTQEKVLVLSHGVYIGADTRIDVRRNNLERMGVSLIELEALKPEERTLREQFSGITGAQATWRGGGA